jgi:AcrR family transcriptional regulator
LPTSPPAPRTPSRWNGLSTEERQRERRQLLIEVAFDLLGSEGSSATTVRAVCARARLNPRYFYESFDELDALLVAVYDSVVDQLRAAVRASVRAAGEDLPEAVRASVAATVHFVDEDRRRGRVLYVEALGNEALNLRRMQTGFDLVELVQRDTVRRRGSSGSEQLDRVGAAMLVGGFSEILTAWLDGRIAMQTDELIDAATALFVAVGEAAADVAGRSLR